MVSSSTPAASSSSRPNRVIDSTPSRMLRQNCSTVRAPGTRQAMPTMATGSTVSNSSCAEGCSVS